ncbi:hypothetical protein A3C96_03245 [Candidatus Uhrbacteria bacterium RIFCSPHIGHO2_02_FULL_60_10]|uniref:Uncharacterized protein n=1 Tax=Candidatus Uhrbacteria bacterium RIFCSPHIGHO2_02_FULL_60_10 TaxID=1802392 RepID=A0A1F7U6M0_9BACT|nr:MAG: hypothetical protein A3C96_03245 [Candidatus Uhrbacteria bacterium RIFCSPHIGHO2_02_FULL_60_10]
MSKQLLKDSLGWGVALWAFGYLLGMMLFSVVPIYAIGWVITPIGTAVTLWVAFKKLRGRTFGHYAVVAAIWLVVAVVFDYFFLVKAFKPADGYYKFDVYLYYALTALIPLAAGWWAMRKGVAVGPSASDSAEPPKAQS